MIDREEYERVVESFLMELQFACASLTDTKLEILPHFVSELQESIAALRDPSRTNADIVGFSFGIIDEFVLATWPTIITEAYALYTDFSGGKSHRHPE